MKKLIALMMCAMLLLFSGCAAVTADGPGVGLQMQDLGMQNSAGQITDLTGLTLSLETAQIDPAAGLRLSLSTDSGDKAELVAAVVDQYLNFTIQSASGTSVYAVDLVKLLEEFSQQLGAVMTTGDAPADGDEEVPELTDEEMEEIIAQWEAAMAEAEDSGEYDGYAPEAEDDEMYAALPETADEDARDQQARLDRASEIIEQCATEGQQQIGGLTYDTVTLHVDADDMNELLNAVDFLAVGDIYFPLGDVLAAGGLTFTFDGTLANSEDGTRYLVWVSPAVTTREGDTYGPEITVDMTGGDGSAAVSSVVTKNGTESVSAVSFVLSAFEADDADWLPTTVPEDAVIVDSLNSPEASQAIADGFSAFIDDVSAMVEDVLASNAP